MSKRLEDYLRFTLGMVQMVTVLELERQVLELRRHPWCGELHWRLTWRLYELAIDEQRLRHARARLLGERFRPVTIAPPERLVAPSERISAAGRVLADVLGDLRGIPAPLTKSAGI